MASVPVACPLQPHLFGSGLPKDSFEEGVFS